MKIVFERAGYDILYAVYQLIRVNGRPGVVELPIRSAVHSSTESRTTFIKPILRYRHNNRLLLAEVYKTIRIH